ncbi:MAG: tyrosine-type recombinase/integrase [Herpetosiphonaceae bacterium]|nr:tyrosine-type recombinase/integrase [Herpetosiphonaceae bacterium]
MEIIVQYLDHLAANGRSPATIRATRADLRQVATWWETTHRQPWTMALTSDRDLRRWQRSRQVDDGAAPATINRALSTLRRFCVWAASQGHMVDNPTAGIHDVATEPMGPQALPDVAVDALLRAARQQPDPRRSRDEALLALLIYTGVRAQEACDVQLRDLDLRAGTLTVRSGKGRKARRIPLHPDAIRLLDHYLTQVRCPCGLPALGSDDERTRLLVRIDPATVGRPLTPGITARGVGKVVQRLGCHGAQLLRDSTAKLADLQRIDELMTAAQRLDAVAPHQLRHSLARRLLTQGAQLPEVQRILGHSRLSTTGMYLTPSEDDVRTAIDRMHI